MKRNLLTVLLLATLAMGCSDAPLPFASTPTDKLEDLVQEVERDLAAGEPVDWKRADEQMEAYCAEIASRALTGAPTPEEEKQDALIGRYWATRVKHMTLHDAQLLLSRKGRQAEAFLEELQQ